MANLGTLIGGRYAGTYNSVDIGFTENGISLEVGVEYEQINESDLYGQAIIDMFYRGGNCRLSCESKEYKAGSVAPFWPYGGGVLGIMSTAAKPIGHRASDSAKVMILTATANTPAAAAPATLTATYAILAPGSVGRLDFNSKLRRVPITLQLLPYDSGGNTIWFALG